MRINRSGRADLWATLSGVWLGMSATAGPVWFVFSTWHFHYSDKVAFHHASIGAWIVLHFVADCVFVRQLGRPHLSALIGFATSLYAGKLLAAYVVRAMPLSVRIEFGGADWAFWGLGAGIAAALQLVIQRAFARSEITCTARRPEHE